MDTISNWALATLSTYGIPVLLLACLAGTSLADHSEYQVGRLALFWLRNRMGHKVVWQ